MNDMRKLINLMEGVEAIPGLQENIEKPAQVVTCNQDNPAAARDACAMEESTMGDDGVYEHFNNRLRDMLEFTNEEEAFSVIQREMDQLGLDASVQDDIMNRLQGDFFPDSQMDHMGIDDFSDDADALASAGHGSDEDYGGDDFPMEEDLNNGYSDVNVASGNDFFPNGADGPVVSATGPSGARQGDNPEQKKMQVAETHKELVYAYRNFLKETASQKK